MPDHVYEVVAQAARYWFLFWMALIAWRSWRWYRKDGRAAKKRLKLLPDAGFVGEMVVTDGGDEIARGTVYPVPREGTLGLARTNDLYLPAEGVERRHLWFRYEDQKGLLVEPFGKNPLNVDGEDFEGRRHPLYMAHGSQLTVGGIRMRLRLFAGFESVGHAPRRDAAEIENQPRPEAAALSPEQFAQMQQMVLEQMQQAYQQGYRQAMAQQSAQPVQPVQPVQEQPQETVQPACAYDGGPDALPYDMAQIAREEGMVDNSIYMRPAGQKKPEPASREPQPETVFYPPVMDEEDDQEEEDWVLEPQEDALPRSAYVGQDEAERAKREVWDKVFGGGSRG